MPWIIVHFIEENTVEAVPLNWLEGNHCYWPSLNSKRCREAIQACHEPEHDWILYKIRKLGGGRIYDNFNKARMKAIQAEMSSDLNSDVNSDDEKPKRTVKRKKFFDETFVESESDESDHQSISKKITLPAAPKTSKLHPDNEHLKLLSNKKETITHHGVLYTDCNLNELSQDVNIGDLSIPKTSHVCNTVMPSSSNLQSRTSTPLSEASDDTFQKQVLRQLNILNFKLQQLSEDINAHHYLVQHNVNDTPENNVLTLFELPLKNDTELQKLEDYLKIDENFSKFVSHLKKIGGQNYKNMSKRLLEKLIANNMASQYSWIGFKKKKNFSVLYLAKLITVTVQTCFIKSTESEIEEAIKLWLVKAKERDKRKENA